MNDYEYQNDYYDQLDLDIYNYGFRNSYMDIYTFPYTNEELDEMLNEELEETQRLIREIENPQNGNENGAQNGNENAIQLNISTDSIYDILNLELQFCANPQEGF